MIQQDPIPYTLLAEILESCLIRNAFLCPRLFQVTGAPRKKDREWLSVALTFNRRIGQLMRIVNSCPDLKSFASVQEARDKLLGVVQSHLTNPFSNSAVGKLMHGYTYYLKCVSDQDDDFL